ncbi:MAG TPA: response regulator transcription factor [Planktothrix sp.]|jgi:two-component system NarL family response regulator
MPSNPLTIVVGEDQSLLRLGIVQALRSAGYTVLAETEDGPSTIDAVVELRPAVLLVKHDLPVINSVACCQRIRAQVGSQTAIIVLLDRASDIWEALRSGANGYALRETKIDLLPWAVKYVEAGLGWIGPNIAQYLTMGKGLPLLRGVADQFAEVTPLTMLSDREQDVARLLIEGVSNQEIADTMGLKIQTVKVHVKNILRKLHASSRSHAVSIILKSGRKGL